MNPRPFHRSRLFLLGLPGLLFLLWLWLGTRDTCTSFMWAGRKHALAAVNSDGILQLNWATVDNPATTGFSGPPGWETTKTAPGPLFPAAHTFQSMEIFTGFHRRILDLAHWFLLLGYLVLWLIISALWQYRKHRKHRLTTTSTHSPPSP